MSILIQQPGIMTTVQDLGRFGYRQLGIGPGGAMDRSAMRMIDILLGNDENAPVLEMHFPAARILFEEECIFAIGGAEFGATLDGEKIANWRQIRAEKGSDLRFDSKILGNRAYLAVSGGFVADEWLGSFSTNLVAGAGGVSGRRLETGDRIRFGRPVSATADAAASVSPSLVPRYSKLPTVRITRGAEFGDLTEQARYVLLNETFAITSNSDRMGFRLNGPPLLTDTRLEMLSSAVNFGSIQLLPDGQLIVLMADHQTTGGYPRIAHVAEHELSVMGQLGGGDKVSFHLIENSESERLSADLELQNGHVQNGVQDAKPMMRSVDLNCDIGEGYANDRVLMDYVSSVNVACGFHAGDADTMRATVDAALEKSVAVGAHPSFPDREHFGRRDLTLSPGEVNSIVAEQINIFRAVCQAAGAEMRHVKPHGALYNLAARDHETAEAIAKAVYDIDPWLILYGLSGSNSISAADRIGLRTASEVFADRTYQADGSLTSRKELNALITHTAAAAAQALAMVRNGVVVSVSGEGVAVRADTICIHGDGPQAVQFAAAISSELKKNNIRIEKPYV